MTTHARTHACTQPSSPPHPPTTHPAGALLASGDRLSGETLAKVAESLKACMAAAGEDEAVLGRAAGAQGALAKHCTPDELRALLAAGPLSPAPTGRCAGLWEEECAFGGVGV